MKKISDEEFQKYATQLWLVLFGIAIGWFFLFPTIFWWLPLFMIVMLIVARELIYQADKKVKNHVQSNRRYIKKGLWNRRH